MIAGYFKALESTMMQHKLSILQRAARYLNVYGIEGLDRLFFDLAAKRMRGVVWHAEAVYNAAVLVQGTRDGFFVRQAQLQHGAASGTGDEPPRQRQDLIPRPRGCLGAHLKQIAAGSTTWEVAVAPSVFCGSLERFKASVRTVPLSPRAKTRRTKYLTMVDGLGVRTSQA